MLRFNIITTTDLIPGTTFNALYALAKYLEKCTEDIRRCSQHRHTIIGGNIDISSDPWRCHITTCCTQMLVTLETILKYEGVEFSFASFDGVNKDRSNEN